MTIDKTQQYLERLLRELRSFPKETEWIEFKVNNEDPQEIGEYISALSNSAALHGKASAYMVWGIDNSTHNIVSTSFNPFEAKKGNEELESWLLRLLSPRIHFYFYSLQVDSKKIVILEILPADHKPVQFSGQEYIRIGTYKKKLKEYPEKERTLWRIFDKTPFEKLPAIEGISDSKILELIDYPSYFDLLGLNLPENKAKIIERMEADDFIKKDSSGSWTIFNITAILFAKKMDLFKHLQRKIVRVILYKNNNRLETLKEYPHVKGYATEFEELITFINRLLPSKEVIGEVFRKNKPMYPELCIRELVANCLIHQDFSITGTGAMIEIFSDRIEITNPGKPLVEINRFLDSPPKSRNDAIASFLRRIGICEERGSGIDKVVFETEFNQLPAPLIEITNEHTRVTLFSYRPLKALSKAEKIRACYLHSCLKYVSREYMTNTSLRERFGIEERNSAVASRVIKDALKEELIKPFEKDSSRKFAKYVPFWA